MCTPWAAARFTECQSSPATMAPVWGRTITQTSPGEPRSIHLSAGAFGRVLRSAAERDYPKHGIA